MLKRIVPLLSAGLMGLVLSAGVAAQSYPNKPLQWVVPFPPGGTMDPIVRLVAEGVQPHFEQPIVVDNKPGAGTQIGVSYVARAKPDGHTIVTVANSFTINPSLYDDLSYDTENDFVPVALLGATTNILVGRQDLSADNLEELVAYAKENPEELTYASFGIGTSSHLAGEMLKEAADIELLHVPYRGSAPALVELMAGRVDLMVQNLPDVLPHIESGKLKAYGVTSLERSALLPEVPTIAEQGYPDFTTNSWYAILAPKGTAPEVVARLNADIHKGLAAKEEVLASMGFDIMPGTPEELQELIEHDLALNAEIIAKAGISLD